MTIRREITIIFPLLEISENTVSHCFSISLLYLHLSIYDLSSLLPAPPLSPPWECLDVCGCVCVCVLVNVDDIVLAAHVKVRVSASVKCVCEWSQKAQLSFPWLADRALTGWGAPKTCSSPPHKHGCMHTRRHAHTHTHFSLPPTDQHVSVEGTVEFSLHGDCVAGHSVTDWKWT